MRYVFPYLALVTPIALAALVGCGSGGGGSTNGGTDAGGAATDGGAGGIDATVGGGQVDSGLPDGGAGGIDATVGGGQVDSGVSGGASVLERNNGPRRDGLFVQPTLTHAAAAKMALDPTFSATFKGNVYASPLYVENGPGGKGIFIVATESNDVFAFDETSGAVVWTVNLGAPATQTGAGCGNIAPIGITGTPYIDLVGRTIYLSAATGTAATITTHSIHALSLDTGASRGNGFPYDVSTATAINGGQAFSPAVQNQRGSLTAAGGQVYVPYGGHYGDCGDYHGWVVAVPMSHPSAAKGYRTPARGAGIWGAGGVASDGTSVFATTGNSFGATSFQGGEAVVRLGPLAAFSGNARDYFVPSNWMDMDKADLDLSGTGPMLIDVPGATPSALVVAMSKTGVVHLADRATLGGIARGNGTTGEGVASDKLIAGEISNVPAFYRTLRGSYVVLHGHEAALGTKCPAGQKGDLVAVKIGATSPPTLTTAWCMPNQGEGSPIVTTTDGVAEVIVWSAGAEGSQRLHAFDADTGAVLFPGGGAGDVMSGVRRFTSPIAVHGRIIVAGNGRVFAFKSQ
jgi:hypothetical protein